MPNSVKTSYLFLCSINGGIKVLKKQLYLVEDIFASLVCYLHILFTPFTIPVIAIEHARSSIPFFVIIDPIDDRLYSCPNVQPYYRKVRRINKKFFRANEAIFFPISNKNLLCPNFQLVIAAFFNVKFIYRVANHTSASSENFYFSFYAVKETNAFLNPFSFPFSFLVIELFIDDSRLIFCRVFGSNQNKCCTNQTEQASNGALPGMKTPEPAIAWHWVWWRCKSQCNFIESLLNTAGGLVFWFPNSFSSCARDIFSGKVRILPWTYESLGWEYCDYPQTQKANSQVRAIVCATNRQYTTKPTAMHLATDWSFAKKPIKGLAGLCRLFGITHWHINTEQINSSLINDHRVATHSHSMSFDVMGRTHSRRHFSACQPAYREDSKSAHDQENTHKANICDMPAFGARLMCGQHRRIVMYVRSSVTSGCGDRSAINGRPTPFPPAPLQTWAPDRHARGFQVRDAR